MKQKEKKYELSRLQMKFNKLTKHKKKTKEQFTITIKLSKNYSTPVRYLERTTIMKNIEYITTIIIFLYSLLEITQRKTSWQIFLNIYLKFTYLSHIYIFV